MCQRFCFLRRAPLTVSIYAYRGALLVPAAFLTASERVKNYVFDTLGGCLKGRRGKECASVGVYGYGKRRTTQKAKALHARANRIFNNSKRKNRKFTVSFLALYCFCGLRTFLTVCAPSDEGAVGAAD